MSKLTAKLQREEKKGGGGKEREEGKEGGEGVWRLIFGYVEFKVFVVCSCKNKV
jgi:hypothetical protein